MNGGIGVVEEFERRFCGYCALAQQKGETRARRCGADCGGEQVLGIAKELEVRLGLRINADSACQGIAVKRAAWPPLPQVARYGRGQFPDLYRGPPQPEARSDD